MQSKKDLPDAISCRYVEFFAKAIFHAGKPGGNAYTTKTDHKGIAMIRITNPGIWWVKVPHKEHYEDQAECDVGQYASIMTFEVK